MQKYEITFNARIEVEAENEDIAILDAFEIFCDSPETYMEIEEK